MRRASLSLARAPPLLRRCCQPSVAPRAAGAFLRARASASSRSVSPVEASPEKDADTAASNLVAPLSPYEQLGVPVDGVTRGGFIVGGRMIPGSILVLPKLYTQWTLTSLDDFTLDSLSLLDTCYPGPDLFVFGTGAKALSPSDPRFVELQAWCEKKRIGLEVMPSFQAVATMREVIQSGRSAAGALIAIAEEDDPVDAFDMAKKTVDTLDAAVDAWLAGTPEPQDRPEREKLEHEHAAAVAEDPAMAEWRAREERIRESESDQTDDDRAKK